jgi:hypothetical protein
LDEEENTDPVTYGQVVHLQHLTSNKFLSVRPNASKENLDGVAVASLTENPEAESVIRILPYYKVRNIGDRVRAGEKVILKMESTGHYLNCDSSLVLASPVIRDVNMTLIEDNKSQTGWVVVTFYDSVVQEYTADVVKGGDSLSFYHEETNSCLSTHKYEEDLRGGTSEEASLRVMTHESMSTTCYWKLLLSRSDKGQVITEATMVRLQHIPSGKYLKVVPETALRDELQKERIYDSDKSLNSLTPFTSPVHQTKRRTFKQVVKRVQMMQKFAKDFHVSREVSPGTDATRNYQPFLTRDGNANDTLFYFSLLDSEKGSVLNWNSKVRLRHARTGMWICASDECLSGVDNTALPQQFRSTYLKLVLKKEPVFSDVFTISQLFRNTLDDTMKAISAKAALYEVLNMLKAMVEPPGEHDIRKCLNIFVSLIKFLNDAQKHSKDEEKRELSYRQMMLFDQGCVEATFDLVGMINEREFAAADINRSEYRSLRRTYCYAYRFLYFCVKGNTKLKEYSMRHLSMIMSHITLDIGADDLVQELITANSTFRERVSVSQLKLFVSLLTDSSRKATHVSYLQVLCGGEEESWDHQNLGLIRTLIMKESPYLLFRTAMKEGRLFIWAESGRQSFGVKRTIRESSQRVRNNVIFCMLPTECRTGETLDSLYEYHVEMLHLVSVLSINAPAEELATLKEIFPVDFALQILMDSNVPDMLRSGYAMILLRMYVQSPGSYRSAIDREYPFCRWGKISEEFLSSTALAQPFETEDLFSFFKSFLQSNYVQFQSNYDQNCLILSVVRLMKVLYEQHSFAASISEAEKVFKLLVNLLDGRTDISEASELNPALRYVENHSNRPIFETKIQVCEMIKLIYSEIAGARFSNFLLLFKEFTQGEKSETETFLEFDALNSEIKLHQKEASFALIPALTDLVGYENQQLSKLAQELVFMTYSQVVDLMEKLSGISIIISESRTNIFLGLSNCESKINAKMQVLRSEGFTGDSIGSNLECLRGMVALAVTSTESEHSHEFQDLLGRMTIAPSMIRLLSMIAAYIQTGVPLNDHSNDDGEQHDSPMAAAVKLILQLLQIYCKRNEKHQIFLFRHFEVFVDLLPTFPSVIDLMAAIFDGNAQLNSELKESQLVRIANVLTQENREPRIIAFYISLCTVNNRSIPYMKEQIARLIADRPDMLLLFESLEGAKLRDTLLAHVELSDELSGMLEYHVQCVDLLASLCKDMPAPAGAKELPIVFKLCTRLFSDEFAVTSILNQAVPLRIRSVYCRALLHMYLLRKDYLWSDISFFVWDLMSMIGSRLSALTNAMISREFNSTDMSFIILECIPLFQGYATHQMNMKGPSCSKLCRAAVDDLCRIIQIRQLGREYRCVAYKCLQHLFDEGLTEEQSERVKNLLKRKRGLGDSTVKETVAIEFVSEENDYNGRRLMFTLRELESGDAIMQFLSSFSEFIDTTYENSLMLGIYKVSTSNHYNLKCLIQYIQSMAATNSSNIISGLRVLRALILSEAQLEARCNAQLLLNSLGATALALELFCSSDEIVCYHATLLAISLLDGGNEVVQQSMYSIFCANQQMSQNFFACMEQALSDVREHMQLCHRAIGPAPAVEERLYFKRPLSIVRESYEVSERIQKNGFAFELMRLLQLTCEGHYNDMQNYIRYQNISTRNKNLVRVSLKLAQTLVKMIDDRSIEFAIQCIDSLTEFVQGPCRENQLELVGANVCSVINDILVGNFPITDESLLNELQRKSVTLLIALMEGNTEDPVIPGRMVATINFEELANKMNKIVESFHAAANDNSSVETGFMYFILLTMMSSSAASEKPLRVLRGLPYEIFHFFNDDVGRIEILRGEKIERIFFRIPEVCHSLTDEAKDDLQEVVNRESGQSCIDDFFDRSQEVVFEIEYQEAYHRSRFLSAFVGNKNVWRFTTLVVALAINILLILCYKTSSGDFNAFPSVELEWRVVIFTLACVHAFLAAMRLFDYYFCAGPRLIYAAWRKKGMVDGSSGNPDREIPGGILRFIWGCLFVLRDSKSMYELLYFVISLLGLLIAPFFFAFHLLDIVTWSPQLKNVLNAITLNRKSLLLTLLLSFVIVYIYAVILFIFFREWAIFSGEEQCQQLGTCILFTFNYGLRKRGGIADALLVPKTWNVDYIPRIIFDMSFFILIVLLILNLIFGVIVDTYRQLRLKKAEIAEDMFNRCFICSYSRYELERSSTGFSNHVKKEHNMWEYVFFLMHLNQKPETEYNGQESYVMKKAAVKDLTFFPVHRALCMQNEGWDDKERLLQISSDLDAVKNTAYQLEKSLTSIVEASAETPTETQRRIRVFSAGE